MEKKKGNMEQFTEYGEMLSVQSELKHKAKNEIDKAIYKSNQMEKQLDSQIVRQRQILEELKNANKGTGNINKLQDIVLKTRNQEKFDYEYKNEEIATPKIFENWEQSVEENRKFANRMGIDLSKPLSNMFSNVEFAELSSVLTEKFGSLRLDKYDYAFATFAGIISGVVDAVFVGTITVDGKSSKLQQVSDNAMNEIVKKYAKIHGWDESKVIQDYAKSSGLDEGIIKSTKIEELETKKIRSAIGKLERDNRVSYDARYGKDLGEDIVKSSGLSTNNHHLRSLAHSPSILGLIVGIYDMMNGTTTLYIPGKGIQSLKNINAPAGPDGIFQAAHKWLNHIMSDIAGASGSKGRGAGIPAPFHSIMQQFQFGKIPIGNDNINIGEFTELLYKNGYDFRSFMAQTIPVILNEVLVRLYWFIKQHYFYGKSIKESIPIGKKRELERLLLVAAASFSAVDVAHATYKGVTSKKVTYEGKALDFFMSLNYVQMADLGYHLFTNIKLEHEHRKEVKELLKNEIKEEWEELCHIEYGLI